MSSPAAAVVSPVTIQPAWLGTLSSLLSFQIPREQKAFHDAMDSIFTYVRDKSSGRCISNKIFDHNQREQMILEMFQLYNIIGISRRQLCASTFMRAIKNHDQSNESNRDFINKVIVQGQLLQLSQENIGIYAESAVTEWLLDFNMTTMDPQTITEQKDLYEKLPKDMQQWFSKERKKVGDELMGDVQKKWINNKTIEEIAAGLESADILTQADFAKLEEPAHTQEAIVAFFVHKYRGIIASGNNRKQIDPKTNREAEMSCALIFKTSLLLGLNNLKSNPCIPKAPEA